MKLEASNEKETAKTVPRISSFGFGDPWFIFNKLSVPSRLVLMIREAGESSIVKKGEAVVTVMGNNGVNNTDHATGNLYSELPVEMFK